MVNQQLLLQNEYLIAENRILRSHLPARIRLTDPQRATLAEIGKRLGRQALERVALVAKPETILGWYRKLIARKFDWFQTPHLPGTAACCRRACGTDRADGSREYRLGLRSNRGSVKNLGHHVSDQTVGNCCSNSDLI